MSPDRERISRMREALGTAQLDAVVCALPAHVLMVSGYWPVIGNAIAVADVSGRVAVLAPQDERQLAEFGWAEDVRVFQPASLSELKSMKEAAAPHLRRLICDLRLSRIAYEAGEAREPASYLGMHLYGCAIRDLLSSAAPDAELVDGTDLLNRLSSVKTPGEMARIREACRIAGAAFVSAAQRIRAGLRETEVADAFQQHLSGAPHIAEHVARAGGYAFCMSGTNAAQAYAAYQRSRQRELAAGDLVLIHCNSFIDGFWTDITRTYHLGAADDQQRRMYDAILGARAAALAKIQPGVPAAEVDRASRSVMEASGLGPEFRHPTGHGVGFRAADHGAIPRLHPASPDVLEPGMVFNVEPGAYVDGYGGMRHCDMVAVTADGFELLTPFHADPQELEIAVELSGTCKSF